MAESQNTPEQRKVPETPESRARQKMQDNLDKVSEFKKDVKFLWIYGSIFCLLMLAALAGSYVIHEKRVELETQVSDAQASEEKSKSHLSAIREENNKLKNENKSLKSENETLKAAAASDEEIINSAEQIILEQSKLIKVGRLYQKGSRAEAKELFESIHKDLLSKECLEDYSYYEERLK